MVQLLTTIYNFEEQATKQKNFLQFANNSLKLYHNLRPKDRCASSSSHFFDSPKNKWYNIIMKKKTVKPGWAEFVNAASLFFMYSWKELISMAQIGIRITEQEKQVLADCAAANDLTISQILRSLIRRFIKENENDTDTKRSRV